MQVLVSDMCIVVTCLSVSFLFLLFSLEEQVLVLRMSDLSFLLNDDCFCVRLLASIRCLFFITVCVSYSSPRV